MTTASPTQPLSIHPPRWRGRILTALSDIKIAHSVFALPFAILAAFLVAPRVPSISEPGRIVPAHALDPDAPINWSRFLGQLALVIVCMVLARTWAMLVNRLADRNFDVNNPRTARRVFASGKLDVRSGWTVALTCAALFQLTAVGFWIFFRNPWPTYLAIPVLAWIALYSFTKRFTWLCHLFLGGALAASPIAATIAVNPPVLADITLRWDYFVSVSYQLGKSGPSWLWHLVPAMQLPTLHGSGAAIFLLAGFVLFWVAGFDVAYALQDLDFDRQTGLHSIPAKLGLRGSLWTSRALHALAFTLLVFAWIASAQLGWFMLVAIAVVAALLIFEHIVLARRGVAGLPLAFFTLNGCVSLLLGATGCLDVFL